MLDRADLVVDQTSVGAVRLAATNIGQRLGVEEGLPIEDKVVLQILRLVLQRFTDPDGKFAGMTYGQFISFLWQVLSASTSAGMSGGTHHTACAVVEQHVITGFTET